MMFPVLGIVFHKAEVGVAKIVESVEMDVSVAYVGLAVIAVEEEVPVFVAEVGVAVSVTGVGEAVTVSWVELVKVKISDFVAEVEELLGALSIT